ncbi:cell wall-active antibiotics response protein [Arthrobacter sp. 9AX]|uniref:cell wall-active antibiotics response protein n=1 Tax=Arthrobacter sp. 9AX TaxID=2653131 RepID=UPI001F3C0888|nr:cell wall-active antibiotics response protein [Arthrobacter sp. 9AX]
MAVVTGLAIVLAGITLLIGSVEVGGVSAQVAAIAWAAAAAGMGLGIVVAGVRGRHPGLLSFLGVVALVSALVTGLGNADANNLAMGRTVDWAPGSATEIIDGYNLVAGSGRLDLRSLSSISPLAADITVPINAAASTVSIIIPADVPVRVNSRLVLGTVQYIGDSSTGTWNPDEHSYNSGAPGGTLTLDLQGALSTINIAEP